MDSEITAQMLYEALGDSAYVDPAFGNSGYHSVQLSGSIDLFEVVQRLLALRAERS